MNALQCYSWPGNVRELENIMQRLVVMNTSGVIEVSDLPQSMRFYIESSENAEKSLVQVEAEHIQRVLRHTGGNKTRAAEILGIDRKTLREKLKQIEGE
jgi:DNA-binding NtrC family response regulator